MPRSVDRSTLPDADSPRQARRASDTPFDSIESAHEFVQLLGEAIDDSIGHTQELVDAATGERHRDALRLVTYKMGQLRTHVTASSKLLNDLRTLRRLLLHERRPSTSEVAAP